MEHASQLAQPLANKASHILHDHIVPSLSSAAVPPRATAILPPASPLATSFSAPSVFAALLRPLGWSLYAIGYAIVYTIYYLIFIPLWYISTWLIAPFAWLTQLTVGILSIPLRIYQAYEALFLFLFVASLIGIVSGLILYALVIFLTHLFRLDGSSNDVVNDVDEDEDDKLEDIWNRKVTAAQNSSPKALREELEAPRSVADFRAARRRRRESEGPLVKDEDIMDDAGSLRWLPSSGQAHLIPLIKESKRGSIDEKHKIPLTEETILEVDSSTDLDLG